MSGRPAACWQLKLGEQTWQRHIAANVLLFFFFFFSFYSYKLYFLYMYVREALMEKYFIERFFLFFFKIMSFKCVNLYVGWTFSRTSACGRSDTDLLLWERDRTSTEELNRLARSCLVTLRVQEGIHFSGHHNASKFVMKTSHHFVILLCLQDWPGLFFML